MLWWTIVLGLVGIFVGLAWRLGPQTAIGLVVPLTWVFPAWLILPILEGARDSIVGTGPDIKVAVSSICLILYCFVPGRTFPVRLVPSDFAMLCLIIVHCVSDLTNDGFSFVVLGRAYAEWYLPYVAGRLALQSRLDAVRLWKWMAGLGILLATCAISEAFFDVNPFESLFGIRPTEGSSRNTSRWGMQRAYGPAMHPIYFGVMQLLFFGWAAYATIRAFKRRGFAGWVFATVPMFLGIAATGSRGPILGILASLIGGVFYFVPKARLGLGAGFVLLFGLGVMYQEPIIRQLEKWSGEGQQEIVLDGETRLQSSVRSRINLIEVNRIALRRSGLLGFGSEAVAGFPINVPLGPREAETLKKVKFVDNTFVLITLRFGYLGLTSFAAASMLALLQFLWIADRYRGESPQWLCCCMGGTVFGTLLVLFTVWMPHEIGFALLWTFGLSAGLTVAHRKGKLGQPICDRIAAQETEGQAK